MREALCRGTGRAPDLDGDLVLRAESGREFGLCSTCCQWADLHKGRYLPHPDNHNHNHTDSEEAA